MIRYLDVCSGYSAFTLASAGLGFRCVGYSEIEAFPRAVLEQRHGAVPVEWDHRFVPGSNTTPLFGDFTKIESHHVGPVDLLAGGTPCQAFSVAGKRLGLDDPRGNLTLEFLALARRVRARWLVWENVPGFLSHDSGRTMGTFLRLLGELGYGWAYRVLDAQYVRVDGHEGAVPQRRRRLFVVAHLGDAAGPAAVLFERESLRGDPAPRRETGQGIAPTISARTKGGGGLGTDFDCDGGLIAAVTSTLPAGGNSTGGDRQPGTSAETAATMLIAQPIPFDTTQITSKANGSNPQSGDPCHPLARGAHAPAIAASLTRGATSAGKGGYAGRRQEDDVNLVAHSLRAEGFDASEDGTGRGTPLIPVYAIHSDALDRTGEGVGGTAAERAGLGVQPDVGYAMRAKRPDAVAYRITPNDGAYETGDISGSLTTGTDRSAQALVENWSVRRLTPTECERLMGVPDGFTAITYRGKLAADGPRYKALGNSQARNVMRWIAHGLADVIAAQDGTEARA